jgi:hypothetical protein
MAIFGESGGIRMEQTAGGRRKYWLCCLMIVGGKFTKKQPFTFVTNLHMTLSTFTGNRVTLWGKRRTMIVK